MDFFHPLSLVLSVLLSLVAAHPGHEPHHGADHFYPPRRERGAPFAGIEPLSTPAGLTVVTISGTSSESSSTRKATGPTTYISLGSSSIGPIPVTIIPVPIATICSRAMNMNPVVSDSLPSPSSALLDSDVERRLPAAATALLRLNSTGGGQVSAPIPTFTAYDGRGCSTLYTRTSSAICSTVLSGLGSIPASVTDCEQSLTFSTSTGSVTPLTTATTKQSTQQQGDATGARLAYFVAAWYDLIDGQVPSSVLVRDCIQGKGGEACNTARESWSVVNQTTSVKITRSLAFEGPVTGPAFVRLGGGLFTTHVPASTTAVLSIHTNMTTATPTVLPSLSRSVIGASIPPFNGLTSTASALATTHTVVLEAVSHTTVTVFQTLTSTIRHEMTGKRDAAVSGQSS